MAKFEINGNLAEFDDGIKNYNIFASTICKIYRYYELHLEGKLSYKYDLYIDNATKDSGYTPVTTPILGKFVIIKLGIGEDDDEGKIAYQFAHELMHYVFFEKYGLNKPFADENEEMICSAASLIILYHIYPQYFVSYNDYVKLLVREGYRRGREVARGVGYDFSLLLEMV